MIIKKKQWLFVSLVLKRKLGLLFNVSNFIFLNKKNFSKKAVRIVILFN